MKYLVPSLTGKTREVSQYMEFDKCTYRDLKERLMKHFEVTTEAQRWKFREKKWTTESTPEAYVREAEQLIRRWLTEDMSPDEIRQQLVIEQLLSGMPKEMQTWVGERQPVKTDQMVELIQLYLTYHPHERKANEGRPYRKPEV